MLWTQTDVQQGIHRFLILLEDAANLASNNSSSNNNNNKDKDKDKDNMGSLVNLVDEVVGEEASEADFKVDIKMIFPCLSIKVFA